MFVKVLDYQETIMNKAFLNVSKCCMIMLCKGMGLLRNNYEIIVFECCNYGIKWKNGIINNLVYR